MDFTFQFYAEGVDAKGVAPFLKSLTLPFSSADAARDVIAKLVAHPDIPAHSVTLKSADGAVSERWFQIDGVWRRKDA